MLVSWIDLDCFFDFTDDFASSFVDLGDFFDVDFDSFDLSIDFALAATNFFGVDLLVFFDFNLSRVLSLIDIGSTVVDPFLSSNWIPSPSFPSNSDFSFNIHLMT